MNESCFLCAENITIFSRGNCGHLICFVCSTKMRVICDQMYCPICRQDLPDVCFINNPSNYEYVKEHCKPNAKGIHFEDSEVFKAFRKLLEIRCQYCDEEKLFDNFDELQNHMNIVHRRTYCNTCLSSLKLFPGERRAYTREEFAQHLTLGDNDNSSFIGHPICKFCNTRFYDKDELYCHSTSEHFFCCFCNEAGNHIFYRGYDELRDHFRAQHYLCEEGDCKNMRLHSNVFRSEIELKAHKVRYHTKNRKEARIMGNVPLDLLFDTSASAYPRRRRGRNADAPPENETKKSETPQNDVTIPVVNIRDEDFPSLTDNTGVVADAHAREWASRLIPVPNRSDANCCWRMSTPNVSQENSRNEANDTDKVVRENQSNGKGLLSGYACSATPSSHKDFLVDQENFPALSGTEKSACIVEPPSWPCRDGIIKREMGFTKLKQTPVRKEITTSPVVTNLVVPSSEKTKVDSVSPKANRLPTRNTLDFSAESFPSLSHNTKNCRVTATNEERSSKGLSLKSLGEALINSVDSVETSIRNEEPKVIPNAKENLKKNERNSFVSALTLAKQNATTTRKFDTLTKSPNDANTDKPFSRTAAIKYNSFNTSKSEDVAKNFNYIKPVDFDSRNVKLLNSIKDSMNDNCLIFDKFKKISADYKNNVIDVNEYLRNCIDMIGLNHIIDFMFELIALLPDIVKQNELHDSYLNLLRTSMTKAQLRKKFGWKISSLVACADCGQLIIDADIRSHNSLHASETDFPALI